MSDLFLNLRFGTWHFQIGRNRPVIRISQNLYQIEARQTDPDWRWFEVM